jgi:hypothetical protein
MITLDSKDVLSRFALLAGLDGGTEYLPLCEDAAAEIERGERETCGSEALGPLTAAAAALAFYRWALAQAGGTAGSFSAGNVKVSSGAGNIRPARLLWREAKAAASPYLADSGFLFRRERA